MFAENIINRPPALIGSGEKPLLVQRARRGFSENEKAPTRPGFSCRSFSLEPI
jgi:hypothetical protein